MIAYIMAVGGGICLTLGSWALWYKFLLSAAGWLTLGIALGVFACLKPRKKCEEKIEKRKK